MESPPPPTTTQRTSVLDGATLRLRHHILGPTPPPRPEAPAWPKLLWGAAQPLLGLRVTLANGELMRLAAVPVLGLLGICVLVYVFSGADTPLERAAAAYGALLTLAPVPSVIFGRLYARLAAAGHVALGLGAVDPYEKSVLRYAFESGLQVAAIAVAVAPVVALVRALPLVGPLWGVLIGGLWALHWVVIEAYDCGRVLPPGRTVAEVEEEARDLPRAWFVRLYDWPRRIPAALRAPATAFGAVAHALSKEWRAETLLMERHTVIAFGFALTTAALLAIPGVNLLFRPAVVVGATHLRSRL